MTQHSPLLTAQSFVQPTETAPAQQPQLRAPQPGGPNVLFGLVKLCSIGVVAVGISVTAVWYLTSIQKPNRSADTFLWLAGQDKTWEEYQDEQRAAGRGRLSEEEYDWTQQLLNDAYSN
jgi:hypothetical protein